MKAPILLVAAMAALTLPTVGGGAAAQAPVMAEAGPPQGSGSYQDLLRIWAEFRTWRSGFAARTPDWSATGISAERSRMATFLSQVDDMNVAGMDRGQRAEFLAARAKMLEHHFLLDVAQPWQRDPGFYVDRMLDIGFAELPATGDALARLKTRLADVPRLTATAKANLENVPGDYADLALHNLDTADGVGHGHPYRPVPPPGVLGWLDDLAARAQKHQPELLPEIRKARAAAVEFQAWLKAGRPAMTAKAGVGKARFDWYLKNVKLLPYTSDQLMVLGARETQRLWAAHALEEHRNRNQTPLTLPTTPEDYAARKARSLELIRAWVAREEIITVPDDIGDLYINVPWIVRPDGPNFWEQVQYRDPTPDLLHATLPGHAFDGQMARRDKRPIRGNIGDGVRAEGWGVYLEEAAQRLGFLEDRPRVRELIDIFGIFRAVRVAGDIELQLNRKSVPQVVAEWQKWTPWLDRNVARVDAEIYLRRPPGYGLGYTVGMIEMQKLLADRRHQLGDKFVLKQFHDDVMAAGRMPLSVIRYDLTGLDDEVRHFWRRDPLPAQ
ncbi:DUF885 family protein [Sandarakinorhabdus sp. AAP62]|uniref:DUF885 family protein n=1 Tax=Sandarakinorhabdus sp. AAP62 TaxID=1248916 RepID=UPI0003187D57|nr:DUF885 family protein [Sandarakinorhabdus sp. AAP62]